MTQDEIDALCRAETAAFIELERQAAVMADDSSTEVGPDLVERSTKPGFEHAVMIDGAVDLMALTLAVIRSAFPGALQTIIGENHDASSPTQTH
jgi:hypothetical protein